MAAMMPTSGVAGLPICLLKDRRNFSHLDGGGGGGELARRFISAAYSGFAGIDAMFLTVPL
jgi:hypothetical protein